MKKIISIFLSLMLVFSTGIFAFAENYAENTDKTANLSVYEQVNGKYLYWNTSLDAGEETLLDLLKAYGLDSSQSNGIVTIGSFADGEGGAWTMTVNDKPQNVDLNYKPQESDRIKLVYEVTAPTSTVPTADTAATSAMTSTAPTASATDRITDSTAVSSALSSTQTDSSGATSSSANITEQTEITAENESTQPSTSGIGNDRIIASTAEYLALNGGDFAPLALKCCNYNDDSELRKKINNEVKNSSSLKAFDLARTIINGAAVNMNLTEIGGANLENLLKNNENIMSSGLKGVAYALMALKHCKTDDEYTNTPEILYELILQNQNADGGFSQAYGEKSNAYLTATALIALSDYNTTPSVKTASEKAILWLLNAQNSDGSFNGDNAKPDCTATAQVIIALRSQDISLDDERFIKQRSVYDSLNDFYNGEAFSDVMNGKSTTGASETALLAYYSCNTAANPYTAKISGTNRNFGGIIFFCGAFLVLIASGVMLIILKKRGKLADNSESSVEKTAEKSDVKSERKNK